MRQLSERSKEAVRSCDKEKDGRERERARASEREREREREREKVWAATCRDCRVDNAVGEVFRFTSRVVQARSGDDFSSCLSPERPHAAHLAKY